MRVPRHIAIIPDGNRRWATMKGMKKEEGYNYGIYPGIEVLHGAKKIGVKEITYYGFTVDNCKRPKVQQEAFRKACIKAVEMVEAEGDNSILVMGNEKSQCFPNELLKYRERKCVGDGNIKVNFLMNYGWKWDLEDGVDNIKSKDISRIDLVIRWGNMRRLSGLLPVQSVYADFYVVDNMWPSYKSKDLEDAIRWYDTQDITLGG